MVSVFFLVLLLKKKKTICACFLILFLNMLILKNSKNSRGLVEKKEASDETH
jgi:hypothetical protein